MSFLSKVFHWLGKEEVEEEDVTIDYPPVMVTVGCTMAVSRKRVREDEDEHPRVREIGRKDSPRRPIKQFRGSTRVIPIHPPSIIERLPEDVLDRCLAFAGGVDDRFAIQATCQQFRRISNGDEHLKMIDVENIIAEDDTVATALKKLSPFAEAGNLKALYM